MQRTLTEEEQERLAEAIVHELDTNIGRSAWVSLAAPSRGVNG